MKTLFALTKRNVKMFFKDKGLFFTSLITPVILLVLYVTFLANVYRNSFTSALPDGLAVSEKLINGMVAGELMSSILAVCCVTVAFCGNTIMVNDRITGARKDILVSPVRRSIISTAYFSGTLFATLIVTLIATVATLIYVATQGWFLSFADVVLLIIDVVLLTSFGTALSCVVNALLRTQGQAAGVGTIVSAGYGFLCGAYMPISSFGKGLQNLISLLPGTYGTSLLRNHALNGVFAEMSKQGFPVEAVEKVKDGVDCNLYFFGNTVSIGAMYGVLIVAILVFVALYVLVSYLSANNKNPLDKVTRKPRKAKQK